MNQNSRSLFKSDRGFAQTMAAYDASVARSPYPLESRHLQTTFGLTHLLVGGPDDGEPVILLTGWNGNASGLWAEFPFILEQFRTYMVDVIGHSGKSAPTRPLPASSDIADWMAEVVDMLSVDRARFIGISGGGWLTLKFASHYPMRVDQAVALSPDGLVPLRHTRMLMSRAILAPILPTPTTARWFAELVTSPRGRQSEHYEDFASSILLILKHFRSQRNPGLLTDGELRRIHAPTLILMGEDECFFDIYAAMERVEHLVPGLVAAEIMPDAGHAITLDQPDALEVRLDRSFGES